MESLIGGGNGSGPGGQKAAGAAAGLVKDSSTANFAKDVIQASMQQPVIVDFWAPWCGPCKQLGPLLEKAVNDAKGAVLMVKINIDENQALAQQLRIQSIPTVYAFFQGRPVDGFQGALPDSEVKAFVKRLQQAGGPDDAAAAVEEAMTQAEEAMTQGDHGTASAIFQQVLQHEPENMKALGGLLRAQIAAGEVAAAKEQFDALTPETQAKTELAGVKAQLELLAEGAKAAGQMAELKAKVAADAKDWQAQFDLAQALYAGGQREEAADALLDLVRRNRPWNEEAARKQLVKYFEAWGPTDPLTLDARRRLSSILFS
jgi:putative thioredoxin